MFRQPVGAEEDALEQRYRHQQARRAELAEQAAAERLHVHGLALGLPRGQDLAALAPERHRLGERHAAVGEAVGDRSALGGVQPGLEHRGEDLARVRGAVAYLDREVERLDALEHRARRFGPVGDDRVAVESQLLVEMALRRGVAVDPGVAVERDRARGRARCALDRREALAHPLRRAEAHPRLHDQLAGSRLALHVLPEARDRHHVVHATNSARFGASMNCVNGATPSFSRNTAE